MKRFVRFAVAVVLACAPVAATAQVRDPAAAAARTAAMQKLRFMHGVWVGPATGANPDGSRFAVTQTERIGPMLGGDILVVEGRGYEADGSTGFNAFGVISYDTETGRYELRSYAQGYAGSFPLTLTADGYVWEIPAGPGVMRYTSTITGDQFREVGDFVMPEQPPRRIFEMNLRRRGDTDWPGANPVVP